MRRSQIFVFYFFTFIQFGYSQSPLVKQWDYRFGGTKNDYLLNIHQTFDKGFILGGTSYSPIGGDKTQTLKASADVWIVKLDSSGHKQWDKDFGSTEGSALNCLEQTTDGGYILGATSRGGIGYDKSEANWDPTWQTADFWIIKVDSLGIKQWDKDFGGTSDDFVYDIHQTFDGGYIIGGYSYSGIGGNKTQPLWGGADYWVVKTDSLGNLLWNKDYGGTNDDQLSFILQTNDSNYVMGGITLSGIGGNKTQALVGGYDCWVVKIDSLGNINYDKDYGGSGYDEFNAGCTTVDGGFVFTGGSSSPVSGDKSEPNWDVTLQTTDYWVLKTDSSGNKKWDKTYGGTKYDKPTSIYETSDGGYLIAGYSSSGISGNKTDSNLASQQTWVIKTDFLGNKLWDKTLHTDSTLVPENNGLALETKDGCYLMGNCSSAGIGGDKTQANWDTTTTNPTYDYWVIKFCDSTTTNIISPSFEQIIIYPNPTNDLLHIKSINKIRRLIVFDLLGVKRLELLNNVNEVDISSLEVGFYFIMAETSDRVFTQNFLRIK